MPVTTSTIEVMATVHDSSPSARQAAMPVTTAPPQAMRSPIECSGGPGRLARLTVSMRFTVVVFGGPVVVTRRHEHPGVRLRRRRSGPGEAGQVLPGPLRRTRSAVGRRRGRGAGPPYAGRRRRRCADRCVRWW